MSFKTKMGSLASYDKGSIELNDDLRHYAFSNIFEVCSKSRPYERVMVASNLEYAAEAVRARVASAKMLPDGVVASREMLPVMASATMLAPRPWREHGHQDDTRCASGTDRPSPSPISCSLRRREAQDPR